MANRNPSDNLSQEDRAKGGRNSHKGSQATNRSSSEKSSRS